MHDDCRSLLRRRRGTVRRVRGEGSHGWRVLDFTTLATIFRMGGGRSHCRYPRSFFKTEISPVLIQTKTKGSKWASYPTQPCDDSRNPQGQIATFRSHPDSIYGADRSHAFKCVRLKVVLRSQKACGCHIRHDYLITCLSYRLATSNCLPLGTRNLILGLKLFIRMAIRN